MSFALLARQLALDAITVNRVSLHDGDPGTTGANYIAGGGKQAATFNAADANGERVLNADVIFTGLGASHAVTHVGIWLAAGDIYRSGAALTGDQTADVTGSYTLKATTTKITA